jgi:ABC-2 type transport system permease protein
MIGVVEVVFASARHQILVFLSGWRIPFILGVVQPTVLLLVTLAAPDPLSAADASRIATGVGLTAFWSFLVWTGAGILEAERSGGTLGACLTSVRDTRLVLVGRSLGVNIICGFTIFATIGTVLLARRQPVQLDHPLWFAAGVAALVLSGLALSVALSSAFVLTRFGSQISSALMYPIFLLAGLLTPRSDVPPVLRRLADLLSLSWAMRFLTSATAGLPDLPALGMVLLLTVVYAVAGGYLFGRISRIARERGTIDLV